MKKLFFILVLFVTSSEAVTVRLRNPAVDPTLIVSTASAATPPVLTFTTNHNLSVNDYIACNGFAGIPVANTIIKVKTVPSATTITIKDTSDVDIAGNSATNIDTDIRTTGNQIAACGKVSTYTVTGWGWFPGTGTVTNDRIKDPDGAGPLVADAVSQDPGAWAYLIAQNDLNSTATCDGATAGLCTVEESIIVNGTYQIGEGWPILNLAMTWYADNSKTRYLNAAKYLFNNWYRNAMEGPLFTACDITSSGCSRGESNDYINFFPAGVSNGLSFLRDQLTTEQKEAQARYVLNDQTTSCVDKLTTLSGGVRAVPSSSTWHGDTNEFASVSVNDRLYLKTAHRNYRIDDGTLTNITVSGSTAWMLAGSGHPAPAASSYLQIANSGVSGLDGRYRSTAVSGSSFSVTVAGVSPGTYSTSGMNVRVPGTSGSQGLWVTVTGKTNNQMITVNSTTGASVYYTNAPWGSVLDFSSSTCGALRFGWYHPDVAPQPGSRFVKPQTTVPETATSFQASVDTYDALKGLTTPYYLSSASEIIEVTAMTDATRTLTVNRGQFLTPAVIHTNNSVFVYRPMGPTTSVGSLNDNIKSMGSYSANLTHRHTAGPLSTLAPLLPDSARARELFEYYWNWYVNLSVRRNQEVLAGLNHAGMGAPGYYFGSWLDMIAWNALIGKNSFTSEINILNNYPGLEAGYLTPIYVTRSEAADRHLAWSDSGGGQSYETDDFKGYESSPYLFPASAPTLLSWLRYAYPTTFHRETVSYRLAYANVSLGDYTTLPTKRAFRTSSTSSPDNFMQGGLAFRQDWVVPSTGTVGFMIVQTGDDHNASYPFPGALMLAKGATSLICGASPGCATFGDMRTLNGVEVYTTVSATTGGLATSATYSPTNGPAYLDRAKIGSDYAYGRVLNKRYNTTVAVTSAHRDLLYYDPGSGGQDYVITYDRVLTGSGRTKGFRIPYFRKTNYDGSAVQNPVPTYSRTGNLVTFDSNQYGVRIHSKLLTPTTSEATYSDNTSDIDATILLATTTANEADFLAVHQPCAGNSCTAATMTLLSGSSTNRFAQIDNGSQVLIAGFAKASSSTATSLSYTAASYAGVATHIITGLQPNTVWDIFRDGVEIYSGVLVDSEGVIRSTATFGSGVFALTSTGAVPLEILTTSVAGCSINDPYSVQLSVTGGTSPYTWDVSAGALPAAITLSGSGLLSGTCPASPATYNFTARVTDDSLSTDTQALSIVVTAPDPPSITTSSLPDGTVTQAYSQTLSATGGTAPYAFSVLTGSLPSGLSLASNGDITGTPTTSGLSTITFRVTDDDLQTGDRELTINVNDIETGVKLKGYGKGHFK